MKMPLRRSDNKKYTFSVQVYEEQYKWLIEESKRKDLSIGYILRQLVEREMETAAGPVNGTTGT